MQNIFIDILPPWVETGLQPAFYDLESGTVLQQTARMYAKVRELTEAFNTFTENVTNEVNDFEDRVNATVEEYIEKFTELHDYVHDYFDNLDVQEEINNKLDQMLEDGILQEIVEAYVQPNITWTYDTIEDMQASPSLVNGCYAKTYGYYSLDDGGGAEYRIVDTEPSGGFYVELNNGNYAQLVIKNKTIYTKQTGAKGDGTTDDTSYIQAIFDLIESDYRDCFTVIVNGYHYVQHGLTLAGTGWGSGTLNNICIKGKDSMRDYGTQDNIKYGFLFDTNGCFTISDFDSIYGLKVEYTKGTVIKDLKFTTNETVTNGQMPLNNIIGIYMHNNVSYCIRNCNIIKFYTSLNMGGGSLAYVKNNNISLSNIGIRFRDSGDCTIEDNYVNTIGWDIYGTDGTLNARYSDLYTANKVFAIGYSIESGGNSTIKGGKTEWCAIGVWQDGYATRMIYDGIHFDRCSVTAMGFTGHNFPNTEATIVNNIFTGCGGVLPINANEDVHIGGVGRSCIGANEMSGLLISSNKFNSDNGSLTGSFGVTGSYFAPRSILYFYKVYSSSFNNNIINVSNLEQAHQLVNSVIEMDGNVSNVTGHYPSTTNPIYVQSGNRKTFYSVNPSTLTDGDFNLNDIVYNINDITTGWKVTTAGSSQTISNQVSVVTVATDYYPGDGSVIDLGTTTTNTIRVGSYVTIAGVTGTKVIKGIIKHNGHFYAKLNTACDVAVLNATMTNVSPVFTSL